MMYQIPVGMHEIPLEKLDLRPDKEIDQILLNPPPVRDNKNVWLFWHSGFASLHGYTKRNVRAWHRRFSKQGWIIRVVDRKEGSNLNVAKFLDVNDPKTFPAAFRDRTLNGTYAAQHTSDLVRFPLLVKHGGIYCDISFLQIGDIDSLWNETIGNPSSPYEVLSYHSGDSEKDYGLANYFLGAERDNVFFEKCHELFRALWNETGGRTNTEGMHKSKLLTGLPPMVNTLTYEDNGRHVSAEELSIELSDYIAQGQVISMVMGILDKEAGWNGPEYVREHVYAIEFMVGAQYINELTAWNGPRAFELMSLHLPAGGETEGKDQQEARNIVEQCLSRSFGFKLAHGLIIKVLGETLGSLWRKHEGSDDVPGTYAHWLRQGMIYWEQDILPKAEPSVFKGHYKNGALLSEY